MKAALAAAAAYLLLALVVTWPLATGLATLVPSDAGDPLLNAWILWWNSRAVPLTAAWWNAPAFFPFTDTLALSEHLFGLSLLTTPIVWLTSNVQLAYNVAFLATFVLSAVGAYWLGHTLTRRSDAAFIAGLAYGFAPYRMAQFAHIQSLASFGMPFALVGLHRYAQTGEMRWLALFAGATLVQGLSNGYYLLFFPVLVALWVAWFLAWSASGRRRLAGVAAAFLVTCVLLAPFLQRYVAVHDAIGLRRGIGEITAFGADVTSLMRASDELAVWGPLLPPPAPEAQLFPGLTIVVLIVAALVTARRRDPIAAVVPVLTASGKILAAIALLPTLVAITLPAVGPWKLGLFGSTVSVTRMSRPIAVAFWCWLLVLASSPRVRSFCRSQSLVGFYLLATVVMWIFAFGPLPSFAGERVFYWAPYRLLMLLPGFEGLRVPARFAMLAVLCLAAAASLAWARVTAVGRPRQSILFVVVCAGILADGWMTSMPLASQPPSSILTRADPPGAVLELPMRDVDVASMHRGIAHGHPVVNGYSGYAPPYYLVLREALELGDPVVLDTLATIGVRHIVVFTEESSKFDWDAYVRAHPSAHLVRSSDGQRLYGLGSAARFDPGATLGSKPALPIASLTTTLQPAIAPRLLDGDPATIWDSGGAQKGEAGETLDLDLGTAHTVGGVELVFGNVVEGYPRRLAIEIERDDGTWTTVWDGRTAPIVLTAALATPDRVAVPIRFTPLSARRIRLRQRGTSTAAWIMADVRVLPAP